MAVRAFSVNPVNTKIRRGVSPSPGQYGLLGLDAACVLDTVGPEAYLFKLRGEVFYAGALHRVVANSAFHDVHERIIGRKPRNLGYYQSCGLAAHRNYGVASVVRPSEREPSDTGGAVQFSSLAELEESVLSRSRFCVS